ncbi:hypothetical protein, partial [Desulfamplus magnetovallimortis]|uniref:hypothetical protein n=1 Tax=Desulfamplus magnetovallimortis TaxID=1246637 RepID=UPI0009B93624
MNNIPHDHNFKNILLDFPVESLRFFFPKALEQWGAVQEITFVRQEPKKHQLSDANLALDMPILFRFEKQSLLLWLVEFQEDKSRFSIHKLMRYTVDLMEEHPEATVIPAVLFTDRRKWRTSVLRRLESRMADQLFVYFEYIYCKLFDFNARDFYTVNNPVVKILLPKMNYDPSERSEVIRQAYIGLFQLAALSLFEKYVPFIDLYAEVKSEEQRQLCQELFQHKETAMLAEYIKDMGRKEGRQEGRQEGEQKVVTMIRNAEKKGLSIEMISEIA